MQQKKRKWLALNKAPAKHLETMRHAPHSKHQDMSLPQKWTRNSDRGGLIATSGLP